ncbi:hypothetical protein [Dyella ginsengisoli]|uniref:hypothetical protein n=1 Tax=Dyella ginsengisoli TaxID=363848 RepID=UPI00034ABCDE|nr:hypothetical protein [Dyella ginsengisoli]
MQLVTQLANGSVIDFEFDTVDQWERAVEAAKRLPIPKTTREIFDYWCTVESASRGIA